jgi:hypothetical protein
MSKVSRRTTRRRRETGALQILEEAFHLLRSTDVACFWTFYLGAVPFALGMLYFVADMSRSSMAQRDAAFVAVAMTALYFWMRYTQAKFCAGLWRTLSPGSERPVSRRDRFASLAALWLLQALHLPILVIGAFFAIPLGWIIAAQQNLSVLALTQDHGGRPLRELLLKSIRFSHHEWAQNHAILLIFFFISLFTWVNIVATCVLVPGFGKSLFGIENIFTLNPIAAVMNTTFILGTFLLMQLVIVPLMLATYVLRCFYADSRRSGADLLSRLATCRAKREKEQRREHGSLARVPLIGLAALSLAGMGMITATPVAAAEAETPVALERPVEDRSEQFRSGITETLEQKKYQWQLSRRALAMEGEEEQSWLSLRIKEIAESAKRLVDAAGEWFEKTMRRLMERNRSGGGDRDTDLSFFRELSSGVSLALVGLILGLLVWLGFILYRRHLNREKVEVVDEGVSAPIDLASEDIVASQLHEDEWLRLAREQIEKGEERLAVRALFLATLAHLGDRGLLKIARFKSNRDYRSELAMRGRNLGELRSAFDENTTLFERVWYGMHRLGEGSIDFYLKNHETISGESTKAAGPVLPLTGGKK